MKSARTAAAVGITALAVLVAATPGARADDAGATTIGSVRTSSRTDDVGPEAVVSLHGVRRVGDLTVVYFSVGRTSDSAAGLPGFLGDQVATTGRVFRTVTSDAMVVDPATRTAYTPLTKDNEGCVVCSDHDGATWAFSRQTGVALVGYVALPALPAATTTVEVLVANRVFEDVPVADGPLEPVATPTDGDAVLLGQGWPRVDTSARATASDVRTYSIHPATTAVEKQDVTTRQGAGPAQYDLSASVLFDKDSAVLRPSALPPIQKVAAQLATARGTVLVTGYTDNLGSHEHGVQLSRERAAAVARALTPLLPPGTPVRTAGLAEADPVASNDTEQGRAQNRRVTITVKDN